MNNLIKTETKIESRRYIGSKAKLKSWIISLIEKECRGESFLDIFAGTGVISAEASSVFKKIIVNDFLYSNYVCYQAFFGLGKFNKNKLNLISEDFNKLNPKKIKENYFSRNFSNKYFSHETSKLIGHIREEIEKQKPILTDKEYYVLLASLLYSVDKVANTVGHYDAYIKKDIKNNNFNFRLIEPLNVNAEIHREDANLLARSLEVDVVYVDPPYNSRQYSRFYHLLETLTKWDKKKLHGVALKPLTENRSEYCTVKAPTAFADLIDNLKCKYIVTSYNNTYDAKSHSSINKIKLEQIKEILERKGTTNIHKKDHKFFNSGKTDFANHQEWLFITKVYG